MKKIGIIGAMELEVETLKAHMTTTRITTKAHVEFHEGTLNGTPVVIVRSGVGKVNAALCVQILAGLFGVTAIINTGVAGSLCNDLDIGDLLVSRDAMYHDVDCHFVDYPVGMVPGMPLAFEADDTLLAYAFAAAESVNPGHTKIGRVASGDQFVCQTEQKARITAVTMAMCTEMEGTAIAQTAFRNAVPFVILRAISDKADDSAQMDYPTFEAIAADRCARVTMAMAKCIREAEDE